MAYSTQRSVSDGTLQLWLITIEFFDQSEMSFYFNDVPTTAYTWATATSVLFNSPVPNGVEVLGRRTTDISEVRHVFSEGAQFKDETLDDDFRQILHIAQEAVEGANVGDIFSTLNMHGNKIINVGTAVDPGDAISFGQVITESESAFAASIAAQASATSASLSASNSAASAAASLSSANASAASAALSQSQVVLATTQAGIATTQAGIATTQAGLATTNGAAQVALATTQANNAAASAADAAASAAVVAGVIAVNRSFRNLLINGDFQYWQRRTSLVLTGLASGYTADQWASYQTSGSCTVSQQAHTVGQTVVPDSPRLFQRHVFSGQGLAAGDSLFVVQPIEDVYTLATKVCNLTFWAKSAVAGHKLGVEFQQNFGTGGSTAVQFGQAVITLTTTFTKYTVPVTVPSISGKTVGTNSWLGVHIFFNAGSTAAARLGTAAWNTAGTVDISHAQFEEGTPTPFEIRPFGVELDLCQRYCHLLPMAGTGVVQSGVGANFCNQTWRPAMRVNPLVTVVSTGFLFDGVNPSATFTSILTQNTTTETLRIRPSGVVGSLPTAGLPLAMYDGVFMLEAGIL